MQEPQESDAIIAIVDDDPSAREGLQRLVRSVVWSWAGTGTEAELAIPARAAYEKRRGKWRFRFGRLLGKAQERAEESR